MKKTATMITTLVAVLAISMTMTISAFAKDVIVKDKTIQSVSVKLDKNGDEYTRIFIEIDKQLNGVEYTTTVPVMAFGGANESAQTLKAGDKLNAVCSENEYRGKTSYQLLSIIN